MDSRHLLREMLIAAAFGLAAWTICAAATSAYAAQLVVAPAIFAMAAFVYFRREEALRPLITAMLIAPRSSH